MKKTPKEQAEDAEKEIAKNPEINEQAKELIKEFNDWKEIIKSLAHKP